MCAEKDARSQQIQQRRVLCRYDLRTGFSRVSKNNIQQSHNKKCYFYKNVIIFLWASIFLKPVSHKLLTICSFSFQLIFRNLQKFFQKFLEILVLATSVLGFSCYHFKSIFQIKISKTCILLYQSVCWLVTSFFITFWTFRVRRLCLCDVVFTTEARLGFQDVFIFFLNLGLAVLKKPVYSAPYTDYTEYTE